MLKARISGLFAQVRQHIRGDDRHCAQIEALNLLYLDEPGKHGIAEAEGVVAGKLVELELISNLRVEGVGVVDVFEVVDMDAGGPGCRCQRRSVRASDRSGSLRRSSGSTSSCPMRVRSIRPRCQRCRRSVPSSPRVPRARPSPAEPGRCAEHSSTREKLLMESAVSVSDAHCGVPRFVARRPQRVSQRERVDSELFMRGVNCEAIERVKRGLTRRL